MGMWPSPCYYRWTLSAIPALRIIGIASIADDPEVDVARDHDDVLADCEIASWPGPEHLPSAVQHRRRLADNRWLRHDNRSLHHVKST